MADKEADFVTILSSDMIAQIVEEYFNKKVYKQQVEVVDTKPTEAGYMFSLAFVTKATKDKEKVYQSYSLSDNNLDILKAKRNNKGQFVKDKM